MSAGPADRPASGVIPHETHLRCDVLVIGSGAGGATTAALLAEAGFDVLVVEEGPWVDQGEVTPFSLEQMDRQYRAGGVTVALGLPSIAYTEGRCAGGGTEVNSGLYFRPPLDVVERWRRDFRIDGLDLDELGTIADEVEQAIQNTPAYIQGLKGLFAKYKLDPKGAEAFEKEANDYLAWLKGTVLPEARTDFVLPRELYAMNLRNIGIDEDPMVLIERAQLEFMETRAAMQALAPLVAKEKGFKVTDYRDVIRELKKSQIAAKDIEPEFRKVITGLEQRIADNKVVDLPKRPMAMRIASEAETAAQPAPNMQPPPLVNNTGQQGTFVLPLGNPASGGKQYDDFTYPAAAWTLTAHEGRPGHELQFTAMVERGVSMARTLFAFNSVNVEGWALYAEAEMVPYEPIEGQLIALQYRLMRAARAMLDPMLNLGLIDRENAGKILREEVVLSEPMALQEVDRYTFNAPGQAGAYFHGYSKLLQLRAETEVALGDKFDRLAFNNFIIDQGLLPPDLLAKAVREQFVPAQRAK